MRLFKIIFCFILFLSCTCVFAQEKEHIRNPHSIGVSIEWNKDISLVYRNEISKNFLFRTNLNAKTSATLMDVILVDFSSLIALSAGVEKRMPIREKLSAYFGGEAKINSLIYGFSLRRNTYFLSGITGIKFIANDKIALFAEAQFGLRFNGTTNNQNTFWFAREVNNLNFGALYTFGKVV